MHNFRLVSKTPLSSELVVDSDQCKHKSIGDQLTIGMISAIVSRTSPAPRAFGIPNEEKNESRDLSREFLQKPCDLYKTTHNDLHYLQMTSVCSTARCKTMIPVQNNSLNDSQALHICGTVDYSRRYHGKTRCRCFK